MELVSAASAQLTVDKEVVVLSYGDGAVESVRNMLNEYYGYDTGINDETLRDIMDDCDFDDDDEYDDDWWDEFDPCEDCRIAGDDYYTNELGEYECNCWTCPWGKYRHDDWDD